MSSLNSYRVITVHFNFVARRKKSVKADNQFRVATEKAGDSSYDSGRVYALTFELLHDVQKVVVDLRLVAEFVFDLVQVGEGVLDFESLKVCAVSVVSPACQSSRVYVAAHDAGVGQVVANGRHGNGGNKVWVRSAADLLWNKKIYI